MHQLVRWAKEMYTIINTYELGKDKNNRFKSFGMYF